MKITVTSVVSHKSQLADNIKLDLDTTIQELDNKASYKYLGVEEGHQICH